MLRICLILFFLLFTATNATAATIQYKRGYKRSALIIDTASVYDTLSCAITFTDKDGNTKAVRKNRLAYVAIGSDTLRSDRLYCPTYLKDNALALLEMNDDLCVSSCAQGEKAGSVHDASKLDGTFFMAGVLTSFLGAAIIWAGTLVCHPAPLSIPDSVRTDCFLYGYEKTARKRVVKHAAGHAFLGAAAAFSLWMIINDFRYPWQRSKSANPGSL